MVPVGAIPRLCKAKDMTFWKTGAEIEPPKYGPEEIRREFVASVVTT